MIKRVELSGRVGTDEGKDVGVEVYYRVRPRLLAPDQVADVGYRLKGSTETPKYIIEDQVRDLISARHGAAEFL